MVGMVIKTLLVSSLAIASDGVVAGQREVAPVPAPLVASITMIKADTSRCNLTRRRVAMRVLRAVAFAVVPRPIEIAPPVVC